MHVMHACYQEQAKPTSKQSVFVLLYFCTSKASKPSSRRRVAGQAHQQAAYRARTTRCLSACGIFFSPL